MRLYLDANAIIYSIEGAPQFRLPTLSWIDRARQAPLGHIMTSRISRLECRSKPLAAKASELLELYERFFALVTQREVTAELIEHATDLRARFALRAIDALHLATAIDDQADVFLTGDRRLKRCTDINVISLSG